VPALTARTDVYALAGCLSPLAAMGRSKTLAAIKAIFWDLGGVLVRTTDRGPRTRLAQRYGRTMRELEQLVWEGDMGYKAQTGAISAADQWAYVLDQLGLPPEALASIRAEFFAADVLDMELVGWIRDLKPYYRIGVISNALDDARRFVEQTARIGDAFDHLTISAEVGVMKPDERIYWMALNALDVTPDQAVFVDDFLHNIEAARAVGMSAIHFRDPQVARRELQGLLAADGSGR
jgi:HAD superfamily hydrolase (TIGR01549 family)